MRLMANIQYRKPRAIVPGTIVVENVFDDKIGIGFRTRSNFSKLSTR